MSEVCWASPIWSFYNPFLFKPVPILGHLWNRQQCRLPMDITLAASISTCHWRPSARHRPCSSLLGCRWKLDLGRWRPTPSGSWIFFQECIAAHQLSISWEIIRVQNGIWKMTESHYIRRRVGDDTRCNAWRKRLYTHDMSCLWYETVMPQYVVRFGCWCILHILHVEFCLVAAVIMFLCLLSIGSILGGKRTGRSRLASHSGRLWRLWRGNRLIFTDVMGSLLFLSCF